MHLFYGPAMPLLCIYLVQMEVYVPRPPPQDVHRNIHSGFNSPKLEIIQIGFNV